MHTAFIIGNGESRNIFPIEHLKGHGTIYGCNAIYRDHPWLCDHVVAVSPEMYHEVTEWQQYKRYEGLKVHGINDISKWDYLIDGDKENEVPKGLKLYRVWYGGDKKTGKIKVNDFSKARGSGCSAVLMAAESGAKDVVILAFDIMGARQWEMDKPSRIQNNIYKDSNNYPKRESMKAYLKYEWMYQLRQIFRKFPGTNFYFINRREYLEGNPFLRLYFDQPNIRCGIYADLQRWITGKRDDIKWKEL